MNNKWIKELHDINCEFATSYCLSQNEVLAYLSSTLIGTMISKGHSNEFAKKVFERMYSEFLKKKEEDSPDDPYEEMPGDTTEQVIKAFKKLKEEK